MDNTRVTEEDSRNQSDVKEYILLGIGFGSTSRTLYYISSGSEDKVKRVMNTLAGSVIGDTLKMIELDSSDNVLELKEDKDRLYQRFGYLLNDMEDEEDLLS